MMSGPGWRWCERRIARRVAADRLPAVLGDLAEDYARRRAARGNTRALLWLLRETQSLSRAYARAARQDVTTRISLWTEVTHAWRSVVRRPATPLACAALLGLAIGLFTAVFSVLDSLVLRPAPFEGAERMIRQAFWRSEPDVLAAWKTSGLFDAAEAVTEVTVSLNAAPDRQWAAAVVTPGVFDMLGTVPHIGRTFSSIGAAADEVILSAAVWRSVFGADPAIVGRGIRAGRESWVVIGVMPESFRFPTPSTDIWRPMDAATWQSGITIYGRIKPGAAPAEVDARIKAMASAYGYIAPNYSGTPPVQRLDSPPISPHTRQAMPLLMGGASLVFVVLTANIIVLLLSRLIQRRQEFATCTALGASRPRLLRQVAFEHVWIVGAGVVASLGVAWTLNTLVPDHFIGRTLNVIDLDRRALFAAVSASVLAALVAGLVPAWLGTRSDTASALRRTDANGRTSLSRVATRGLLVAQIALASGLLVGSAVLLRSFVNLATADRGLEVDGVDRIRILDADEAFPTLSAKMSGIHELREHVATWPEVSAAAISREIPPLSSGPGGVASVETLHEYRVSSEFFSLYGIDIVAGHLFRDDFVTDEIIIGTRLAQTMWPNETAVGRIIRLPRQSPRRVVGVVREITLPALDPALDRPEFYLPLGNTSRTLYLNLRCAPACPPIEVMRARLRTVHPALRASRIPPGELAFVTQLQLPEATAQAAAVFAVVALATATCGLYTVLTFVVRQRRREFGIRQMLGASPAQLRQMVFRDGLLVVTGGVAIGAATGWAASQSLSAFLYGVTFFDAATWAAPLACLTLASLAAMWVPSKIAANTDPLSVVREE